jgi:hypothetical protein
LSKLADALSRQKRPTRKTPQPEQFEFSWNSFSPHGRACPTAVHDDVFGFLKLEDFEPQKRFSFRRMRVFDGLVEKIKPAAGDIAAGLTISRSKRAFPPRNAGDFGALWTLHASRAKKKAAIFLSCQRRLPRMKAKLPSN